MEPRAENVAIRAIVDDVLAEDESHKAKRKLHKDPDTKQKKSVRFTDVDDVHEFEVDDTDNQEDGPIKEHLLGQAWQKRQLTRDPQAHSAGDMDFNLGSEDAPEEDAEYDHLDGEEVSAFNMKDEEAEGFNAATGEILPRKTEDDEVAEDPWLLSLQHEEVTIDAETKERLEKEQAAIARIKPLSEEELAEARSTLIDHMQPRETVMQAMARLSAKPSKSAPQKAADRVGKKRITPEEQARLDLIERFTDAASSLLSTEADIFEQHREELQHSLRMSSMLRDPAVQSSGASTAPAAGDSDDDMFADSDAEAAPMDQDAPQETRVASEGDSGSRSVNPGEPAASAKPVSPRTLIGACSSSPQVEEARAATEDCQANDLQTANRSQEQDYSGWPISELRRVLMEAQVDVSGATEKADLVQMMKDLDRQRAPTVTPVGFVLDPVSGYYFNAETGWYFHAQSGCYYRSGKWYHLDTATGSYQEMQS